MNPSFSDLKAVLFDFGGTLDDDGLTWREQFFPIYKKAGFDWTLEEFDPCFYFSDDALTDWGLRDISFEKTIRMQVSLLLRKAGRFEPKIAEKISRAYIKKSMTNLKKNIPLLRKLKKKYRLGIVSNFYGNLPFICGEIGYDKIFGAIIDSGRVGVLKPNPKIFLAALKKLKVSPSRALFVGDSFKRDMLGARGIGMRHIWVVNPQSKPSPACCPKDLIIPNIRALEKILL